jgi:hypothetical protein
LDRGNSWDRYMDKKICSEFPGLKHMVKIDWAKTFAQSAVVCKLLDFVIVVVMAFGW